MDVKTNLNKDDKKAPLSFLPEHTDTSYRERQEHVAAASLNGCVIHTSGVHTSSVSAAAAAAEAELLYKTVIWDDSLLQPTGKKAAGSLFKIECSEDAAVCQLHLPHCETKDALLLDGLLSVVHMTDDGVSILEPLEITDTHVVVKVPHLSAFGLVWDVVRRFLKTTLPVKGQVQLFLRPMGSTKQVLDVFLLQDNIPLHEVAVQQGRSKYIKMSSNCHLVFGQRYSVQCPEGFHIQPDVEQFHLKNGANFFPTFEVFLTTDTEEVTVMVQDQESKEVWKRHVSLKDPRGEIPQRNVPAVGIVPAEDSVPAEGSVPAD